MDIENLDIDKFQKKNSFRHHYIPKFLLDGFKNAEGFLYVFDKKQDKILDECKAPKSIFFERDRNTIDLPQNKKSSIIEDRLYSKIDNDLSLVVKYFQKEKLENITFNEDNTAQFLFFLITLFWRIPITDYAVKDLINRAEINSKSSDPEILRNDPAFQKLQRSGLFKHTVDEMRKFRNRGSKFVNIHQMSKDLFVIGDNPLLFRKSLHKFSEFGETDFLIAISSRRIYSSTNLSLGCLPTINSLKYNATVINQSKRYIASSELEVLQKSVQFYKEFCKRGINYTMAECAFEINY